jgi:hypothetical protein
MRRLTWYLGVMFCLMPTLAMAAAEFSIDSATYLRFQQYAAPGFDKKFQAPATQYLTIDAAKLGVDGLSLHFYGWGDATMGSTVGDESRYDGNLTYFYLDYRLPANNASVKAGRMFVFDGLANEQIDGVSFRTDLPMGLTFSAFGGAPTKLDYSKQTVVGPVTFSESGNKGDTIIGGRMSERYNGMLEVGVSTLYEGGIRTNINNGTLAAGTEGYIAPGSLRSYRQLVGGDFWLSPVKMVDLNGHTFYDLASSGIAENSYLLAVRPMDKLTVNGEYTDQSPKNYYTSNLPSLFNPLLNDKMRRYGATVTLAATKAIEVSADYRRYNRENKGNSNRCGFDVRGTYAENKLRTGFSYHRVTGADVAPVAGVTPATRYDELRGFAMYDAHAYVLAFDGIAQLYNQNINGKDSAFELLASVGYRLTPHLLISGDISYGQNPDYNDEVKGLLKVVYNFSSQSTGAHK